MTALLVPLFVSSTRPDPLSFPFTDRGSGPEQFFVQYGKSVLSPALAQLDAGGSVIPVDADKKPLILTWKLFQTKAPTPAQVNAWFERWPGANYAVVCGRVSGIVVLDFDTIDAYNAAIWRGMPRTYTVRTARGYHLYFKYDSALHTGKRFEGQADLKSDGGYVVGPGSVHQSGAIYTVIDDSPAASAPAWLFEGTDRMPVPNKELFHDGIFPKPTIGLGLQVVRNPGAYWRKAVAGEVQNVLDSPPDGHNIAHNVAAYKLGRVAAALGISDAELEAALCDLRAAALQAGQGAIETIKTSASGARAGLQKPRDLKVATDA